MKEINTMPLTGFMELLPEDQFLFDHIKGVIEKHYKKFGFLGLDTPIIERSETLLAKAGGETEKQIYRFMKGDTDLSLRFDLTVPLARYVVEHYNDITFPFKRYQIGKVFRGERPQKGRYREFFQSDVDVIGDGELSICYDAELPLVIYSIFKELGFDNFTIKINNRKILNGLFDFISCGVDTKAIMQTIDKLDKIGIEEVLFELQKIGVDNACVDKIDKFLKVTGSSEEKILALKTIGVESPVFYKGLEELESVMSCINAFGMPSDNYSFDPSVARGLDYYTGTVYETFLNDHPAIGSVCSGGRYDDLAGSYTKRRMPGVGVSIGLTRLFSQLKQEGVLKTHDHIGIDLVILPFTNLVDHAFFVAKQIRELGLNVSVYMEDVKMAKKIKYADRLKCKFVLIVGEDEVKSGLYTIKNIVTGEQQALGIEGVIKFVKGFK